MNIPIHEFRACLVYYLRLAAQGEKVVVTSRKRPLVCLSPFSSLSTEPPFIPGIHWSTQAPTYYKRRIEDLPEVTGEPLSDWVLGNRR